MLRTLNPCCATKVMWGNFHLISTWFHPDINKPLENSPFVLQADNTKHKGIQQTCLSRSFALWWWLAFWQLAFVNRSTSRNAVSYMPVIFIYNYGPCFVYVYIHAYGFINVFHAVCAFAGYLQFSFCHLSSGSLSDWKNTTIKNLCIFVWLFYSNK